MSYESRVQTRGCVSEVLRQDSEYRSPEQNAPQGTLRSLQEEGRRRIVARCAEDRTIKGGGQDSLGRARARGRRRKKGQKRIGRTTCSAPHLALASSLLRPVRSP